MNVFCETCGQPEKPGCAALGHKLIIPGENQALVVPRSVFNSGQWVPPPGENDPFYVPPDEAFELTGSEFLHDAHLDRLAAETITLFPEDFAFVLNFNFDVSFVWKRKGGSNKGRPRFGMCTIPTPIVRHFMKTAEMDADFLIWMAADNCRGKTRRQMRPRVFHELKHLGVNAKNAPMTRPHDYEGTSREIEVFGPWNEGASRIIRAAKLSAISEEDWD